MNNLFDLKNKERYIIGNFVRGGKNINLIHKIITSKKKKYIAYVMLNKNIHYNDVKILKNMIDSGEIKYENYRYFIDRFYEYYTDWYADEFGL